MYPLTRSCIQSFVYYWIGLRNSQTAVNKNPPYPPQTSQDSAAFVQLLQALGTGLGNAAAHELAHQIAYTFTLNMHCNVSVDGCQNGNNHVFEIDGAPDWEYLQVYPDIQWQPNTVCAIRQYFTKGYRSPDCTQDYTK